VLLQLLLRDDDSEDIRPHLVSEDRFNLGHHALQVVPGGELTLEALSLGPVGAVLQPDVFDPLLRMLVDDRSQTFQRNFLGAGTVLDIRDSLGEGEDGLDLQDAGSDGGGLANAPAPLDIRERVEHEVGMGPLAQRLRLSDDLPQRRSCLGELHCPHHRECDAKTGIPSIYKLHVSRIQLVALGESRIERT
jgi:hypothetical protein